MQPMMKMRDTEVCGLANGGVGQVAVGTKRRADESNLHDSERFAKRFNLLNIGAEPGANSNYYIPVSASKAPKFVATRRDACAPSAKATEDGLMHVDDTRDRVYIHNLDDELADTESNEEKLVFLPDIERRFCRIPSQLLTGRKEEDHVDQQLVLYSVPKSLTVDEGHDSVRKAILEARQRARVRSTEEARQLDMDRKYSQHRYAETAETAHGYSTGYGTAQDDEHDPDAMEMD